MTITRLKSQARFFVADASAGVTIWALFNFMIILFFAGLALDVNNAVRSRTQLQGAADAAGHAAIYAQLKTGDKTAATAAGVKIAEANMPTSLFGEVLATADVEFGNWDRVARTFTPGTGDTAVRVSTRRLDSRGNSVGTFLMDLLGIATLELNTTSVWDYEDGICVTNKTDGVPGEGFFAIGDVDMQTGNVFGEGFCIHSETYVKLSTGNTFKDDVFISMPDLGELRMPESGWTNNTGINDALHQGGYPMLRAFFKKPGGGFYSLVNSYDSADTSKFEYVNVNVGGGQVLTQAMIDDAINAASPTLDPIVRVTCAGNKFDVAQDETLSGIKLVTDCNVKFMQGSALENMTLVTTSTDIQSISGPSGTRWGNTGYCGNPTSVGGVTVMTMGSIQMAADFEAHGLEILAAGSVNLAAKADGFTAINIVTAGSIDITANSNFGFCPGDAPNSFMIPAFRMVM